VRRAADTRVAEKPPPEEQATVTRILPYGVNKGKLQQATRGSQAHVELVASIEDADLLLTTKNFYRRRTQALRDAEERGKPVYVLRKNTTPQIHQFLRAISRSQASGGSQEGVARGIREAEDAVAEVDRGGRQAQLSPQGSYIRHLQHQIAEEHGLASSSSGREPGRHVVIYRR
jgi:hypothetical protein